MTSDNKSSEGIVMKAQNVSLSLGSKSQASRILEDVSLSIGKASMTALIGPNGAGKTSLLKCLLGLHTPDSGEIEVLGKKLSALNRRELALSVAYVPQLLEASIPFTVKDFVMMGRYAHQNDFGGIDKEAEAITAQLLERVQMEHMASRSLQTLSGGERQKVCIAAALAQQAEVLVLDEPSAHLDPRQREEIHHLLTSLVSEDKVSVIAVTHDLHWVASDFDSIYGMKEGRVVAQGTGEEVIQKETLHKIFGAEFTVVEHPDSGKRMVLPSVRTHGEEAG